MLMEHINIMLTSMSYLMDIGYMFVGIRFISEID